MRRVSAGVLISCLIQSLWSPVVGQEVETLEQQRSKRIRGRREKVELNNNERDLQSGDTFVQFFVYNSDTNAKLATLQSGNIFDISIWGIAEAQMLNIEAVVGGGTFANSIRFVLDTNVVDRIDGGDQKFMCGNGGTDVYSCPALTLGKHTIQATPFTQSGGNGIPLGTFTINFELVKSGIAPNIFAPPPPVTSPAASPAAPPVDPTPTSGTSIQFALYNAVTDTKIADMRNGTLIVLNQINVLDPTSLGIEAVGTGSVKPESIKFTLNGNQYTKIEGGARAALCGNIGNDFLTCSVLTVGQHSLLATAYSQPGAGGDVLGSSLINFEIASTASVPVSVSPPGPAPTPFTPNPNCSIPKVRLIHTTLS